MHRYSYRDSQQDPICLPFVQSTEHRLTEEDGKTVYEVELEDGQQELQLLMDANGTVLQEQKD